MQNLIFTVQRFKIYLSWIYKYSFAWRFDSNMSKIYLKLQIQKEIYVLKKQIFKPENTKQLHVLTQIQVN